MGVTSKDRPDYDYWVLPHKERPRLSQTELETLRGLTGEYSRARFPLGKRFRLIKDTWGIPEGSVCVIVSVWPETIIFWEKLKRPFEMSMSFNLDIVLEALT